MSCPWLRFGSSFERFEKTLGSTHAPCTGNSPTAFEQLARGGALGAGGGRVGFAGGGLF